MTEPLKGIRVLDLSRILAGPVCTQILGDLGAEIIKIEKPGVGDDTRFWGPPFLKDGNGHETTESAYYLSANRNKRSVAIDLAKPEGRDLIFRFLETCDVLVENFKVGGLEKYGLGYDQLKDRFPRLIYAGITGFGQTGPLATEPGYDFLTQAMSGFMAATGPVDNGPTKAGIAISDYITGLYTAIGILAALQARQTTDRGQMVDCALLDCSVAMMTNVAQYYLTSGKVQPKIGNAHATIVPYQDFESADGRVIIAVGNDSQFKVLCDLLGHPEWATDPRFSQNCKRVEHRQTLLDLIVPEIKKQTTQTWLDTLRTADIPVARIRTMDQVFTEPQVQARQMEIELPHPLAPAPVHLIGSPLKLSETPVSYRTAPPPLGQDTADVLKTHLNLTDVQIADLAAAGVIGLPEKA